MISEYSEIRSKSIVFYGFAKNRPSDGNRGPNYRYSKTLDSGLRQTEKEFSDFLRDHLKSPDFLIPFPIG
jgi:hypothetical protein